MQAKLSVSVFACVVAGIAGAATVVHDAGYDLTLNSPSRAVYTNLHGGVWSFMRSTAYNGVRTLMPAVRNRLDREDSSGKATTDSRKDSFGNALLMERGPAKGNASPCFSVNPTSIPDDNTFMRGAAFPLIPPGQMSCHPGSTSDAGNQCVVLRFTMPRNGEYALNVKAWHQNVGKAGVTLLKNGGVAVARKTSQGPADGKNIATNDFSLAAAQYKAGDFVELAVDGNGTYNSNAMGFKFEVVETVDEVVDGAEAFSGNLAAETPTNPFATPAGIWEGDCTSGGVSAMIRLPLVAGYARTSQGGGLVGFGYREKEGDALALPWLVINDSDAYVTEVDANGKPTYLQGRAVAPCEMVCHPDIGKTVIYRLSPESGGIYDIGVTMRDISWTTDKDRREADKVGVDVYLLQGGQILAQRTVSVEGSPKMPGVASCESVFLPNVAVVPNFPIEIVVDSRGDNNSDATAFRFALIRRGDFETNAGYYANAAMKANMRSEAPATHWTHNGANWAIGILPGGINGTSFSEFTTRANSRYNGNAEGFGNNATSSPFVFVNLAERTLSGAADGMGSALSVGRDALITHPAATGGYPTAVRFTVPETGVYQATAWYKDNDSAGGASAVNGAAGYVLVNGYVSGVKTFRSEGASKDGNPTVPYARIQVGDLYLVAGEKIDFVVDPNSAVNNDLTTLQAWATKTEGGNRYVSFDIDGHAAGQTARGTYAGGGRVGFTGSSWVSFKVEDGAAEAVSREHVRDSAGVSVTARLAFSRVNGDIVATAANVVGSSKAPALLQDGVVSAGKNDPYAFTVSGLLPGKTYTLWFYSRRLANASQVSTNAAGTFTVNGVSDTATHPWFTSSFGDYANLTVVADAEGCVTGTFASSKDDAAACWSGLQITGPGFHEEETGAVLIIR